MKCDMLHYKNEWMRLQREHETKMSELRSSNAIRLEEIRIRVVGTR